MIGSNISKISTTITFFSMSKNIYWSETVSFVLGIIKDSIFPSHLFLSIHYFLRCRLQSYEIRMRNSDWIWSELLFLFFVSIAYDITYFMSWDIGFGCHKYTTNSRIYKTTCVCCCVKRNASPQIQSESQYKFGFVMIFSQ